MPLTRARRFGLLAALYFAQGLPFGFFTLAVPVLLRARGYDLATVAASSLLLMPWGLKFLVAPLVDRFGEKRAWIVPLQVGNAMVLAALAFQETSDLRALAAGMFLVALCSATQDVATDGLAVAVLPESERGVGNGIQVGAYRLGMVIGGGLLPWVFDVFGPGPAFASMAVASLLAAAPVVGLVEDAAPNDPPTAFGRALLAPWLTPAAFPWLAALCAYKAGDAMATPMVKPMLVDQGWSLPEIGALTGLVGSSIAMGAAMAGGLVVARTGLASGLLVFGLLQSVAQAGFGFLDPVAVVAVEHLVGTFATVALFTAMMERCRRPGFEATDYTVQASWVVGCTGLLGAAGGLVAERVGYPAHFALCGAVSLLGTWMAWRATR